MLFKRDDVFEIGKYNNPNRDCKIFTRIKGHSLFMTGGGLAKKGGGS
jgi:hypothetical protein